MNRRAALARRVSGGYTMTQERAVSLEKFIEDLISRAMEEGEFDNLPGKGKPLDLDWYFQMPEDLRLSYSILRDNKILPQEAELLKEIDDLKKQLDSCPDEKERRRIAKQISEKRLSFNTQMESRRGKK
jgi:hypothetical protein